MRIGHRARVKRGDLIVIDVGRDKRLRGKAAVDLAHEAPTDLQLIETIEIGLRVVADGGHRPRLPVEQLDVVGNIAGAPAEFSP